MTTNNTTPKIDPLNGDNYTAWKRCLEWILDNLDLWPLVDGTEKEPEPVDVRNPTADEKRAVEEWRKRDKKTRKEICLRVSDKYLVYIDQTMTAREIWTRLQGIFESKAAVGIVNIRHEFFRTFAKDSTNIEEHVRKLRGLYLQLNARGQMVSGDNLSNTLLTSLLDLWSTFITTVNASGITLLSENLIPRILDEDCIFAVPGQAGKQH